MNKAALVVKGDTESRLGFARGRIWIAVAVLVLTPLTSNLPRGVPFPFFHLNEIILLAGFGLMLLSCLGSGAQGQKLLVRLTWLDPLFGLLFLTGTLLPLLGYLFSTYPLVLGDIIHLFDLIQFYMLYRIVLVAVDDERKILKCLLAIVAAGVILATIGILEARDLLHVRQFLISFYPSHNLTQNIADGYPRTVSLLGTPQVYGAYLATSIFICLTLLLYAPTEIPRRFVAGALLVCFFGFVPSGAYSATIGAVIMFGVLLFFYRRLPYWAWGAGALAAVAGGIVFSTQLIGRFKFQYQYSGAVVPATLVARLDHWRSSLALLSPANWLLGYRGTFAPDFRGFEEQYIALVFRGGILFLAAYLYLIARVLIESYTAFRRSAGVTQATALCTFIVMTGFSIMGLSDSYFTNSGISEAIWTLISLTALHRFVRK